MRTITQITNAIVATTNRDGRIKTAGMGNLRCTVLSCLHLLSVEMPRALSGCFMKRSLNHCPAAADARHATRYWRDRRAGSAPDGRLRPAMSRTVVMSS